MDSTKLQIMSCSKLLSQSYTAHPYYNQISETINMWRCKESSVLKRSHFEKQLAIHKTPYCIYLCCLIDYEMSVIVHAFPFNILIEQQNDQLFVFECFVGEILYKATLLP